jgi:hypothetical protein
MGERGMSLMLEKAKDSGLSSKLVDFLDEYASIRKEAADQLTAYGHTPRDATALEATAQWMGVQIGTLADKSPSRMAEMLITGSAKNIINGIEDIKRNQKAQQYTRNLAGRLVSLEHDSLAAMKTYLS